ncbi:hypothetical protein HCB18_24860 [Salinispora arenicola]|nr:hypothetical protein [Salinispora arenicola]NIL64681.1 hypothetical protein [Salinispora arenicola]
MSTDLRTVEEVIAVLRPIWEEVLETTVDEPTQNFFELGGDSLLALVVADQATKAGLTMPLSGVLRLPTLRSLADAVLDPSRFDHW